MESLSTERLVDAIHGITAQLEDLIWEMHRTRRALETIADYMPVVGEALGSIAAQMPTDPGERKELYAKDTTDDSA